MIMRIPLVTIHFEHDTNFTFEYQGVLYSYELERLYKERFFDSSLIDRKSKGNQLQTH